MLDLDKYDTVWDLSLAPKQFNEWEKEEFDLWWTRNSGLLSNLHPQIAEQWVYKHWTYSPYTFLPLQGLTWKLETWPTNRLLSIHMPRCGLNAEWDYEAYNKFNSSGGHPTSRAMNSTGTWDYPVVILHTPQGVRDCGKEFPFVRYLLIEGHSRMRYLNALAARGKGEEASEHSTFVMSYK